MEDPIESLYPALIEKTDHLLFKKIISNDIKTQNKYYTLNDIIFEKKDDVYTMIAIINYKNKIKSYNGKITYIIINDKLFEIYHGITITLSKKNYIEIYVNIYDVNDGFSYIHQIKTKIFFNILTTQSRPIISNSSEKLIITPLPKISLESLLGQGQGHNTNCKYNVDSLDGINYIDDLEETTFTKKHLTHYINIPLEDKQNYSCNLVLQNDGNNDIFYNKYVIIKLTENGTFDLVIDCTYINNIELYTFKRTSHNLFLYIKTVEKYVQKHAFDLSRCPLLIPYYIIKKKYDNLYAHSKSRSSLSSINIKHVCPFN